MQHMTLDQICIVRPECVIILLQLRLVCRGSSGSNIFRKLRHVTLRILRHLRMMTLRHLTFSILTMGHWGH